MGKGAIIILQRESNKRKQQAMETKNRIYDATMSLIEEKGFENVQIIDIRNRANVSNGLFYYYFKNKADVLTEAFIANGNKYHQQIYDQHLIGLHGLDKIYMFIERLSELRMHFYRKENLRFHYINMLTNIDRSAVVLREGSATMEILREALQEAVSMGEIKDDAPIEEMANHISIVIRGVTIDYLLCPDAITYDLGKKALDIVKAYLVGFLLNKEESSDCRA